MAVERAEYVCARQNSSRVPGSFRVDRIAGPELPLAAF